MYAKIVNGIVEKFPYSIRQLRMENPRTSFPNKPNDQTLASFDIYRVEDTAPPKTDDTQVAYHTGNIILVDGVWKREWAIRDKRPDEYPIKTPEEARREMVKWVNSMTSQILDLYPEAVQRRWTDEENAARAVLDGSANQQQIEMITREGGAKGRTPEEHANEIVANANKFRTITDQINTLFLATDAKIKQAEHPSQYTTILEHAKEQAKPLAAAYGFKV